MLANSMTATPRPVAPGRAKRMASVPRPAATRTAVSPRVKSSPPPPYAQRDIGRQRVDSLLGSPVAVTSQMVEYFRPSLHVESTHEASGPEDWMEEKSREELHDLLVRADQTIKEREDELSLTSSVCKGLFQDNILLREKHRSLVSRIPGSSTTASPVGSPRNSGFHHFPASSFTSSLNSPPASSSDLPRRTHGRRISVSPADLLQLADQNAELLQKLETLEHESVHADLAGRRRLRVLEREIAGLREELDQTRERSKQLEDQAHRSPPVVKREARRRTESDTAASSSRVQDYAPPSMLGLSTPERSAVAHRHTSPLLPDPSPGRVTVLAPATSPINEDEETEVDPPLEFPSIVPTSLMARTPSLPQQESTLPQEREREYAVVSQLLNKIQELEETNANIADQQRETGDRLRIAQRDAETMRMLYAAFGGDEGDEVEVEVVMDDDPEAQAMYGASASPAKANTIRFKSLRRTIEGDMARMINDPFFEAGIESEMRSTLIAGRRNSVSKPRRTLAGLFEPTHPTEVSRLSETSFEEFPNSSILRHADRNSDPSEVFEPASPQPVFATFGDVIAGPLHPTLGSELGSEFGSGALSSAGLGLSGDNHHLRTTSLYGLEQFQQDLGGLSIINTPAPGSAAQLEPETPSVNLALSDSGHAELETFSSSSSLFSESPNTLRSRRLGKIIRDRANQWTEARFGITIPDTETRARSLSGTTCSSTPATSTFNIRAAFEAVVDIVAGRHADYEPVPLASSLTSPSGGLAAPLTQDGITASPSMAPRKQRSMLQTLTELYLWMQFVIIILVFVYTMLRKGPHILDKRKDNRHH